MEEEQDRILLSTLGVQSANPEDIERHIFDTARNDSVNVTEDKGNNDENECERLPENVDPLSKAKAELHQKLRAIEFEIGAVSSTIERPRDVVKSEECEDNENLEEGIDEGGGSELQRVLAADRLRSLKKTKAQLEKELKSLSKDGDLKSTESKKVIFSLVKEDRKPKKKLIDDKKVSKRPAKRFKTVSFDDDDDFDAVLDAASAGFVETERDELVRKGMFTPFHKLKGFERGIQQPEASTSHNAVEQENTNDLAYSSVERAARSFSQAAKARPTSKLLRPEEVPKLDAPTIPFRRLKKPMQLPKPLDDNEGDLNTDSKRKKKRPGPGRKWTKRVSSEDRQLGESGMSCSYLSGAKENSNRI